MVNWRQLGVHGKRKLRNSLRALKGQPRPEIAVQHCLAPALAPMACIDVGASFAIHRPWELFLHSPNVLWLAVEPNSTDADYLKSWPYPAQLQRCNEGLSGTGGQRTLYITHNPNGSSILQPRIPTLIQERSTYEAFFLSTSRDQDRYNHAEPAPRAHPRSDALCDQTRHPRLGVGNLAKWRRGAPGTPLRWN